MKNFRLALSLLKGSALLFTAASCSSDQNVLDFVSPYDVRTTPVQLHLRVAGTRAEGDLSTDEENDLRSVNLYVFDADEKLDTIISNKEVTNRSVLGIELSSAGTKTIYAISAGALFTPEDEIAKSAFEATVFDTEVSAHLDKIKTDNGFVMTGCSESQQVHTSGSANEIPATNIFNIRMERLVAKTQVDCSEIKAGDFGFNIGDPQFRVCQTNKLMRVVPNGDVVASDNYEDNNPKDGTYDIYYIGDASEYIDASKSGFTADNCKYMSENIVGDPKSGNTTFVIIKVPVTPKKTYTFPEGAESPVGSDVSINTPATFYAVGIVDRVNGMADYTVDSDKNIITFSNKEDAERYKAALNGGESTGNTVSESESVLKVASRSDDEVKVHEFETVEFTSGLAYYRVNIGETKDNVFTPKVERNKFYRISINSIKTLGYHSENLLRPQDPEVDYDKVASTWIDTAFDVKEWVEEDLPTNL